MKETLRRLLRLESNAPTSPAPLDRADAVAAQLQAAILATWLGNLQSHEAIATGHARALGYSDFAAFKNALAAPGAEWRDRHNRAWSSLLNEHGVGPASSTAEIAGFLARMVERMPLTVQDRLQVALEGVLAPTTP